MPFILKKFPAVNGKKIQQFLIDHAGFTISTAQKMISRARVFDENNNIFQLSQKVKCEYVQVAMFEGQTRGLKPIFNTNDFAVFDKPTGVMVHPTSRHTEYTLLDEIRYHFGESANLAHRIDQETSGLVLVTKNKYSDMVLKEMFENKEYQKRYLAIVEGKVEKNLEIDKALKKDPNSMIGVKMCVADDGKESFTTIKPLKYDVVKDQTLVEAMPITGRQHQIRVHLHSMGHRIVGDPVYGVEEKYCDLYLRKALDEKLRVELTGHDRLLLQANNLEFTYNNYNYIIYSKLSLK